jgi:hypothetical protein
VYHKLANSSCTTNWNSSGLCVTSSTTYQLTSASNAVDATTGTQNVRTKKPALYARENKNWKTVQHRGPSKNTLTSKDSTPTRQENSG